jgi:peptidoglycan/LPS O-acetylase OafA/YrhL
MVGDGSSEGRRENSRSDGRPAGAAFLAFAVSRRHDDGARLEEQVMMQLERTALGAAVVLSVVSIGDAVLRATSDAVPPWDDELGTTWVIVATNLVMAVTFGLLAAVLIRNAERIDEGSGATRWMRRVLAVDLAILASGFVFVSVFDAEFFGVVAGVTFLAMFVLGAVLGGMLLRRPDVRVPAALMVAVVPVIGLSFAVEALAPGWGHPGYAETALYIGIALLGLTAAGAGTAAPERTRAGTSR